MYQNKYILRK